MLKNILECYPNAEIWCCTLSETYISNSPEYVFKQKYAGIHIEDYNDVIRKISKRLNCKVIDVYNWERPYDTIDGFHPNRNGMKTIAESICYEISDIEGRKYAFGLNNNSEFLNSFAETIEFDLSYGDFPIHKVNIFGNRLRYCNKINGSRDGGLKYPDDFFDEKKVILNPIQMSTLEKILDCLELEEITNKKSILPFMTKPISIGDGAKPKEKYEARRFDGVHFRIKNPKQLVDFCEKICDFVPYMSTN